MKFSGSENMYGNHSTTDARRRRIIENPRKSFMM